MSKRFTETTKWRDAWYRRLSPAAKLLWLWMTDNCNQIGLIDVDLEAAAFDIGGKVEQKHINEIASRLQQLSSGKYFIPKFITFQYGVISHTCPAHKPVIKLMELHRLEASDIGYQYPSDSLCRPLQTPIFIEGNGQAVKSDEEKGASTFTHMSDLGRRIAKWYRRRESTLWEPKELKSLQGVERLKTPPEDIDALENYVNTSTYARRDLLTLLNNWNTEIDRAKRAVPEQCGNHALGFKGG